jgi:hypothetical protein
MQQFLKASELPDISGGGPVSLDFERVVWAPTPTTVRRAPDYAVPVLYIAGV